MEKNIGVGIIIGILITSTTYVYKSENLTSYQKAFLYLCIVFPPLQWVSIIIFLIFNQYKSQFKINNYGKVRNTNVRVKNYSQVDDGNKSTSNKSKFNSSEIELKKKNLRNLYKKGILNKADYLEKIEILERLKIDNQVEKTDEYKQLRELLEDNIISSSEYKQKINILRNKVKSNSKNYHQKLSIDGFKKAVEIYNLSVVQYNSQNLIKLKERFEQLFNDENYGKPKTFILKYLIDYQKNGDMELLDIKLIKSISDRRRGYDKKIGKYDYWEIEFVNEREYFTIAQKRSEDVFFIKIGEGFKNFNNLKSCLNYITNLYSYNVEYD